MPATLKPEQRTRRLTLAMVARTGAVLLGMALVTGLAAQPDKPGAIKLAVFDFELEDASPTAVLQGKILDSAEALRKVTSTARTELEKSGRYALIDVSKVDARAATEKALRRCDGCEAGIALQLGAEQSLLGVVIRATATDYYILIRIRDARTGKILDEQSANFAGSEEGWASGVRMLIKHQLLAAAP